MNTPNPAPHQITDADWQAYLDRTERVIHEPRIVPSERGQWRGACSCGWEAEVDWPYLGAAGDAYDHVAEMADDHPSAGPEEGGQQ